MFSFLKTDSFLSRESKLHESFTVELERVRQGGKV